MANPLGGSGGTGDDGSLRPGESRSYTAKDKKTGEEARQFTVHRTDRPYVFDLCDAYNASLKPEARERGLQWRVLPNGELKLEFSDEAARKITKQIEIDLETERSKWIRRHLNTPA